MKMTSLATDWTEENGTRYKQGPNGVRVYQLGAVDRIKPLRQYLDTAVASQYEKAHLDQFRVSFHKKLKAAKKFATAYVKKFESIRSQGKGYYLYSQQPGSGKTMLACCILNELSSKYEVTTQAIGAVDLMKRLKDTFNNEDISEKSILNPMIAVNVLLIDDIGSQKETEWSDEVLYHIVDSRMSHSRPTFFTSNFSIDRLGCHKRIKSRINSTTAQIGMPEKDVRAIITKEEQQEFLNQIDN